MIYFDPQYVSHMDQWEQIQIPYVGFSERTSYDKFTQDIVIDYDIKFTVLKPKDDANEQGYDLQEMVSKYKEDQQHEEVEKFNHANEQSKQDTGTYKVDPSLIAGEQYLSGEYQDSPASSFGKTVDVGEA